MTNFAAIDRNASAVVVEHTDRRCFLRINYAIIDRDLTGTIVVDCIYSATRTCVI